MAIGSVADEPAEQSTALAQQRVQQSSPIAEAGALLVDKDASYLHLRRPSSIMMSVMW